MRDYGLVEKIGLPSMWDVPLRGNLKDFIRITPRGERYLRLREEIERSEA